MGFEHLKTPQNLALNQWGARLAYEAIARRGSALPAQIVTPMGPLALVRFAVNTAPFVIPNQFRFGRDRHFDREPFG